MHFFFSSLFEDPWFFFSWCLIVVFSICAHEFAHAWTALRCGDDTAAINGHLSFNPIVQMGPGSLLVLALFGIAWGAVPVNPNLLRRRGQEALVAVAGPGANLTLCIAAGLCSVLLGLEAWGGAAQLASAFFALASVANGVLFFFNLLPVPMFDGWTVFSLFIPRMRSMDPQQAQTVGGIFLLVVFITPVGEMIWRLGTVFGKGSIAAWRGLFAMVNLA